jgi:hypothetical protein
MSRKNGMRTDRQRTVLAQEAARIIVEQGIQDFRVAKLKAAERLGMHSQGALPTNAEIDIAVGDHLRLFGGDSHPSVLLQLRSAALSAMQLLAEFSPRLVGPVLAGTAAAHSAAGLHLFADHPEAVSDCLEINGIRYRVFERRLKYRRGQVSSHCGFRFEHDDATIEATVFAVDGLRQAPISPVDGRPMRRADAQAVTLLLESP